MPTSKELVRLVVSFRSSVPIESDGRIILKESQWIRCLCLGVCVCMCVFSGRQVSLDLVLRWMSNSVCVCACTSGLFFALLLRVANSRMFWWLHREQFKVRRFSDHSG